MDVMQPQFADEQPINPFDFWEGANFKLKIRNVEGYRNYDKSEFDKPVSLYEADETKLEAVYDTMHELAEFVDPKSYKTYDELKAKMQRVLGENTDSLGEMSMKQEAQMNQPTVAPMAAANVESVDTLVKEEKEEDDTMSYFAKLAQEG